MEQVAGGRAWERYNKNYVALFLCAMLVILLVSILGVTRVHAQVPPTVSGQIFNGTKDAPPNSTADLPVTLFQITEAGPVTRTVQTDAAGKFTFDQVITNANTIFTRLNYGGIQYYSTLLPAELTATTPLTTTVYETMTMPADFTIDHAHFILDVQPKRLNGLTLVQVTNPTDRAFFMPLPVPDKTTDVSFEDIREQTRIIRQPDGNVLYPILPTTSEILYGIVLPYTPPDYQFTLPLRNSIAGINVLVSKIGDVRVTGAGLVQGAPFTAQNGQQDSVTAADEQKAGTTFSALISNLPGVDNTGTTQSLILVVGGLGALFLLAYPIYRRRTTAAAAGAVSDRMARLQEIAQLDDQFAAHQLDETEYHDRRDALKAELLTDEPL